MFCERFFFLSVCRFELLPIAYTIEIEAKEMCIDVDFGLWNVFFSFRLV